MAMKTYSVRRPGTHGRLQSYSLNWTSYQSPRDAEGNLKFVPNPYQRHEEWETYRPHDPSFSTANPFVSNSYPTGESGVESLRNRARGAFISQMNERKNPGGLGMSLLSLAQTRRMVIDRLGNMSKTVLGMNRYYQIAPRKWVPSGNASWAKRRKEIRRNMKEISRYEKGKKMAYHPALRDDRRRRELRALGGTILEGMFGWGPLFSDISDLASIEKRTPPASVISASVQTTDRAEYSDIQSSKENRWSCDVNVRLTYSGMVRTSNPNLYLANQLGLLNLAAVAWDRVPWSFLVNMFANVNQVLGSFTDFVGVEISDFSETTTVKSTGTFTEVLKRNKPGTGVNIYVKTNVWPFYRYDYIPPVVESSKSTLAYGVKKKNRVLTSGPSKPTLEFRVPTPSLGLAAIGLGLALQKGFRGG